MPYTNFEIVLFPDPLTPESTVIPFKLISALLTFLKFRIEIFKKLLSVMEIQYQKLQYQTIHIIQCKEL